MRRALAIAGVLLGGLLASGPTLATAAEREVERNLAFDLKAEGFSVQVYVLNNDGDVDATILINRGPRIAYYSAPAQVTADRVTARFGRFGELDYRFAPKRGGVECHYDEEGEAAFEGSFVFTGQNGYVHVDAPKAEGAFQVSPAPKDCPRSRLARRVVPYTPSYSDKGATLGAKAGSLAQGGIREVTVYDDGERGRHRALLFATLGEVREGVTVARGVQMAVKSSAFRWNLEQGAATLRPPAPFTGSATFTRRGNDGHGSWRGSLRMPIFGGKPVKLAGGAFRAFIHRGVPQDR